MGGDPIQEVEAIFYTHPFSEMRIDKNVSRLLTTFHKRDKLVQMTNGVNQKSLEPTFLLLAFHEITNQNPNAFYMLTYLHPIIRFLIFNNHLH